MFNKMLIAMGWLLVTIFSPIPILHAAEWIVPEQIPTIQQAIDLSVSGDQILVSPGTYLENLNFLGKDISLVSTGGPSVTIIDGSANTQGADLGATVMFSSGESSAALLNGFTLQGGTGIPISDSMGVYRRGGGVHISASSPTIINCHMVANAAEFGSGLYAYGTISLNLQGLNFTNNSGLEGSGIYLLDSGICTINNCLFESNQALTAGGAISINTCSQVLIQQCSLLSNSAIIGGALYSRLSNIQFTDNQVRSNLASLLGGGITLYQTTCTVTDCRFSTNSASRGGGIGIDGGNLEILSSLFTGNTADADGTAISTTINLANVEIRRSTFSGNSSTNGTSGIHFPPFSSGGASSTLTLSHSILWNPSGMEIDIPTIAQVDYSTVSSGYPGTSVLVGDPLFEDPTTENYSLTSGSPCIDAGDPLQFLDPDGTNPDLGAYFFDQRPAPLKNLSCSLADPCGTAVTLDWSPSTQTPDSILISIGPNQTQLTPIASLAGDVTNYTLDPGSSGDYVICAEPIRAGMTPAQGPSYCEVVVPTPTPPIAILNLQCSYNPSNCIADLSWTNGSIYLGIQLVYGGQNLALPGSVNSVSLPLNPGTLTTFQLIPQIPCGQILAASECQLLCPIPEPRFLRGDANMDSLVNLADASSILEHLYQGSPAACSDSMDTNDDSVLDISDPIFLLLFLFGSGQAPPAPGLSCGQDPGPDDSLTCQNGLNCP